MEYRPEDIIASKHGKKESRLVARHQGRLLEIAHLRMLSGGSFVFCLTSPASDVVKIGRATLSQGQMSLGPNEKVIQAKGGVHFSLHPPSKINPALGNSAHIRSNGTAFAKGAIHDSVLNNWHPVETPRNILIFSTAPMESLAETKKESHFVIPVPDTHAGSLKGKVDFYPRDTETVTRYKDCFNEIRGYCPDYLMLISFFLHQPSDPTLLYPERVGGL